jgi:hypothetical protein
VWCMVYGCPLARKQAKHLLLHSPYSISIAPAVLPVDGASCYGVWWHGGYRRIRHTVGFLGP